MEMNLKKYIWRNKRAKEKNENYIWSVLYNCNIFCEIYFKSLVQLKYILGTVLPNLVPDISVSVSPRRTVRKLKVGGWSDNQEHFSQTRNTKCLKHKIQNVWNTKYKMFETKNRNLIISYIKYCAFKIQNMKYQWLVRQSGTLF